MLHVERSLHYVFQMLARSPRTSDETFRMNIPETLFYQHGSLRIWYYTDDNGDVMKRDKRDCNKDKILDFFCSGVPEDSSQPVAIYLHYSNTSGAPKTNTANYVVSGANVAGPRGSAAIQLCSQFGEEVEPVSIEYFDREGLQNFLATRDNKHDVIVQKFVMGSTQNFSTLQVIWSPFKTLVMQRQNVNNIHDERMSLYNRCNTFENTSYLSREVRTTPRLVARMGKECQRIVDHCHEIDQRQILRMVAFFAFDRFKRPIFLWASEVQVSHQPMTLNDAKKLMAAQTKRRLLLISPPTVFGDVITPTYLINQSTKKVTKQKKETGVDSTSIVSALRGHGDVSEQLSVLDSKFSTSHAARPNRLRKRTDSQVELSRTTMMNLSLDPPARSSQIAAHGKLRAASADPIRSRRTGGRTALLDAKQIYASSATPGMDVRFCRGGGGGFYLMRSTTPHERSADETSNQSESFHHASNLTMSMAQATPLSSSPKAMQDYEWNEILIAARDMSEPDASPNKGKIVFSAGFVDPTPAGAFPKAVDCSTSNQGMQSVDINVWRMLHQDVGSHYETQCAAHTQSMAFVSDLQCELESGFYRSQQGRRVGMVPPVEVEIPLIDGASGKQGIDVRVIQHLLRALREHAAVDVANEADVEKADSVLSVSVRIDRLETMRKLMHNLRSLLISIEASLVGYQLAALEMVAERLATMAAETALSDALKKICKNPLLSSHHLPLRNDGLYLEAAEFVTALAEKALVQHREQASRMVEWPPRLALWDALPSILVAPPTDANDVPAEEYDGPAPY